MPHSSRSRRLRPVHRDERVFAAPTRTRPSGLSSLISPILKISLVLSAPSAEILFADCFSQSAKLVFRRLCIVRGPAGFRLALVFRTRPRKLSIFSNLASRFLKTKVLTMEPCLQRVEKKQFAPNTPGGSGGGGLMSAASPGRPPQGAHPKAPI